MGNVGGLRDIDNGGLRVGSVGLYRLDVPPRKHGEAGLWMRRWTRDPFPSDGHKIASASGASKLYRLMGEGVRGIIGCEHLRSSEEERCLTGVG